MQSCRTLHLLRCVHVCVQALASEAAEPCCLTCRHCARFGGSIVYAGLHESNAGGLGSHHSHPGFQLMGCQCTRNEGEASAAESSHGLLEWQRSGTGLPCLCPPHPVQRSAYTSASCTALTNAQQCLTPSSAPAQRQRLTTSSGAQAMHLYIFAIMPAIPAADHTYDDMA